MQPGGGFVETTGPAIPQALPAAPIPAESHQLGCSPGFITAPFITACLDNAVVVPIVQPTGMSSWPISSYRTFPRGESNASATTVNLSALSRRGISNERKEERKKGSTSPLNVPSQNNFARLSGTISPIITEKDRTLARASREKWDETRRKCSAPELRSLNCLLWGTNKKYLTRETRVGHWGEFVPGVKANLRSSFLTSVSRERPKWEKSLVVCVHKVVCVKDISTRIIYGLNNERKENVILESDFVKIYVCIYLKLNIYQLLFILTNSLANFRKKFIY